MHEFISGSNELAQLLERFYKLLESFEIKHLTEILWEEEGGAACYSLN